MTVEEHIVYFAKLKGIPQDLHAKIVEETLENLELEDYKKIEAGKLSGGNQRKLQVALSIIGNPPIILLDEPSAGMDPEARNSMWKVIESIVA